MPTEELEKVWCWADASICHWGWKSSTGQVEILLEVIYSKMRRGVHYKNIADSYAGFYVKPVHWVGRGVGAALCLSFRARSVWNLSGGNAGRNRMWKNTLACRISKLLDTRAVTGGLGLIVQEIAEAAQNGVASMEELLKASSCAAHISCVYRNRSGVPVPGRTPEQGTAIVRKYA